MAKRRLSTNAIPMAVVADRVEETTMPPAGKAVRANTTSATASAALAPLVPAATESKQARLLAMLRRAEGATIAELMAVKGWMSHSVRGTLSAVIKRKLGLTIESHLEADRGRVYCIAPPPPPVTKPRAGRRKAQTSATSVRTA